MPAAGQTAVAQTSVALWSMKGGVGVTVTAAAMAIGLAARGHDVLLVDLGADLASVLGVPLEPGPGLTDWLASPAVVTAAALHRIVREVSPGVGLLPSGSASLDESPDDWPDRLAALGPALRASGKALVVDAGSLVGPPSRHHELRMAVVHAMAHQWLVTRRCYLAVSASTRSPVPPDGVIVVSERHRALTAADAADALRVPLVAECGLDSGVARIVDSGLLLTRAPRSLCRMLGDLPDSREIRRNAVPQ